MKFVKGKSCLKLRILRISDYKILKSLLGRAFYVKTYIQAEEENKCIFDVTDYLTGWQNLVFTTWLIKLIQTFVQVFVQYNTKVLYTACFIGPCSYYLPLCYPPHRKLYSYFFTVALHFVQHSSIRCFNQRHNNCCLFIYGGGHQCEHKSWQEHDLVKSCQNLKLACCRLKHAYV